jgi:hypothetical protein
MNKARIIKIPKYAKYVRILGKKRNNISLEFKRKKY